MGKLRPSAKGLAEVTEPVRTVKQLELEVRSINAQHTSQAPFFYRKTSLSI